jgi:hypothetical protein
MFVVVATDVPSTSGEHTWQPHEPNLISTAIAALENRRNKNPSLKHIRAITTYLRVPCSRL